jgi:hypothetical protein
LLRQCPELVNIDALQAISARAFDLNRDATVCVRVSMRTHPSHVRCVETCLLAALASHGSLLSDAAALLNDLYVDARVTPARSDDVGLVLQLLDTCVRCYAVDAARFGSVAGSVLQWCATASERRVRDRAMLYLAAMEQGTETLMRVFVRPTPPSNAPRDLTETMLAKANTFDEIESFL